MIVSYVVLFCCALVATSARSIHTGSQVKLKSKVKLREEPKDFSKRWTPDERTLHIESDLGHHMTVVLFRSKPLLAPSFEIHELYRNYSRPLSPPEKLIEIQKCQYQGDVEGERSSIAYFTGCLLKEMSGVIMTSDSQFSLSPMKTNSTSSSQYSHSMEIIVKRKIPIRSSYHSRYKSDEHVRPRRQNYGRTNKWVELLVFLDHQFILNAKDHFNDNVDAVNGLAAAMVYGIFHGAQAMYNSPSLKDIQIELVILRMYIITDDKTVGDNEPNVNTYLDQFCRFQFGLPKGVGIFPDHWDHATLVTGHNVYAPTNDGDINKGVTGAWFLDTVFSTFMYPGVDKTSSGNIFKTSFSYVIPSSIFSNTANMLN